MKRKNIQRESFERIQADPYVGLSAEAVDERARKGYLNIATDPNEKSTLKILASNLFTFFNTVLFSIAFIILGFIIFLNSIGRSDIVDTYFGISKFVFLIPAVMNVTMGTFQEIKSLKVIGGCNGNLQGIARLVEGMDVDTAISKLDGIRCGFKPTSCPDQFAQALKAIKAEADA